MPERNRVEQEERSIHLMRVGLVAGVIGGVVAGEVIHYLTGTDVVTRVLVDSGLAIAGVVTTPIAIGIRSDTQAQA